MPVTLQDVARATGVDRSTVCRALADSPRVKAATRQRIQQIAESMGYMPNAVARGLITRRTNNLGVMVLDIADPFTGEIVRDIEHAARRNGCRLILSHCGYDAESARTSIQLLLQQRVDAVIVPDPAVSDSYLPLVGDTGVPLVIIGTRNRPYRIGTDNVQAAMMGVSHLLDLGHVRVAYIGSARDRLESLERQLGFERALLSRGILPDPDLIVEAKRPFAAEGGRECMNKLMGLANPPTAVFCYSDLTAVGALAEMSAAAVRVPEDVSVLGFDDIALAAHLSPPLTTVAQQRERMAELAVEMVLSLLANETSSCTELLPGRLIVRASTGRCRP